MEKKGSRLLSVSQVVMTQMVLPSHTNSFSSLFGGIMMSWIDTAASISAGRYAHGPVLTARIDALDFLNPAFVGWVIELKAQVSFVGKTSMEVEVHVTGELFGKITKIAEAFLTFVAIDEQGKPRVLPKPILKTEEEKYRFEQGRIRRENRLKEKKK